MIHSELFSACGGPLQLGVGLDYLFVLLLKANILLALMSFYYNVNFNKILYFSQKQMPENIARVVYDNKARLRFARQLFL